MSVTMDDLAYYIRRCQELEKRVEKLIKEKALLEEKASYVSRCIHHNCSICEREDYNWI